MIDIDQLRLEDAYETAACAAAAFQEDRYSEQWYAQRLADGRLWIKNRQDSSIGFGVKVHVDDDGNVADVWDADPVLTRAIGRLGFHMPQTSDVKAMAASAFAA